MMKENFTSLHRACLMTDWMTMRKSRGIFGRRMPVMIVLRCTDTWKNLAAKVYACTKTVRLRWLGNITWKPPRIRESNDGRGSSWKALRVAALKGWRICETQYFAKCKFSEIEGNEMQQWKRVCRLLKTDQGGWKANLHKYPPAYIFYTDRKAHMAFNSL